MCLIITFDDGLTANYFLNTTLTTTYCAVDSVSLCFTTRVLWRACTRVVEIILITVHIHCADNKNAYLTVIVNRLLVMAGKRLRTCSRRFVALRPRAAWRTYDNFFIYTSTPRATGGEFANLTVLSKPFWHLISKRTCWSHHENPAQAYALIRACACTRRRPESTLFSCVRIMILCDCINCIRLSNENETKRSSRIHNVLHVYDMYRGI